MADQLARLTGLIVANYLAGNSVAVDELPAVIRSVGSTLATLGRDAVGAEGQPIKATPAQIRRSLANPDVLISFIDGKAYKTLKRHLSKNGLTIPEYKARFGLPSDYPTTSPGYSAARSRLAVERGLGKISKEGPTRIGAH